jgi:inorganic pyrophosphatase
LADVGDEWRNFYFSEVQKNIESDLKNALLKDIKKIGDNPILPQRVAQLCIWDAEKIIERLPEIRSWFVEDTGSWMINLVDIKRHCSYFVCDDKDYQENLSKTFNVRFEDGFAKLPGSYLRKEIIKKTQNQGD